MGPFLGEPVGPPPDINSGCKYTVYVFIHDDSQATLNITFTGGSRIKYSKRHNRIKRRTKRKTKRKRRTKRKTKKRTKKRTKRRKKKLK